MKRYICRLLICLLALVMGASAQTLSFAQLPVATNPTLVPNGYDNLDWSGFFYVDPAWSAAGAGFRQGPNSLNVGFMGGRLCEIAEVSCSASISSNNLGARVSNSAGFQVKSAIVAAGYHSETINVLAYNRGQFVGSQTYSLSTSLQSINFPSGWGTITQLVIDTTAGTVVLYDLEMGSAGASAGLSTAAQLTGSGDAGGPPINKVGASALNGGADSLVIVEGPTGPPINKVGATAPVGVIDPLGRDAQLSGSGDPVGPPINKVDPHAPVGLFDPPPH